MFLISMNFIYNIHQHKQETERKTSLIGGFTLTTSFGLFKLFHVTTLSSRLQLVDIMLDAERKAFKQPVQFRLDSIDRPRDLNK